MTFKDPDSRDMRKEPPQERLQVDPALRQTRIGWGWGWGLALVVAILLAAAVFYATNQGNTNVAQVPTANPPVTSGGAGPAAPQTYPSSSRGTANAPPASTNASRAPAGGGQTTGSGQ